MEKFECGDWLMWQWKMLPGQPKVSHRRGSESGELSKRELAIIYIAIKYKAKFRRQLRRKKKGDNRRKIESISDLEKTFFSWCLNLFFDEIHAETKSNVVENEEGMITSESKRRCHYQGQKSSPEIE